MSQFTVFAANKTPGAAESRNFAPISAVRPTSWGEFVCSAAIPVPLLGEDEACSPVRRTSTDQGILSKIVDEVPLALPEVSAERAE
jgi:hypothetical protein